MSCPARAALQLGRGSPRLSCVTTVRATLNFYGKKHQYSSHKDLKGRWIIHARLLKHWNTFLFPVSSENLSANPQQTHTQLRQLRHTHACCPRKYTQCSVSRRMQGLYNQREAEYSTVPQERKTVRISDTGLPWGNNDCALISKNTHLNSKHHRAVWDCHHLDETHL